MRRRPGPSRRAVRAPPADARLLDAAASGGLLVHALAGHAAPGSLRLVNLVSRWAHLLAVGIWIGGLT